VTSDLPVVHLTASFYIKIEIFTFKNRKMVPDKIYLKNISLRVNKLEVMTMRIMKAPLY
jgi:hypothetical protein